jgi:hypothetical protein
MMNKSLLAVVITALLVATPTLAMAQYPTENITVYDPPLLSDSFREANDTINATSNVSSEVEDM